MPLLKAWTLASEDRFVAERRSGLQVVRLELAKPVISLDRIHAVQQCPAHIALGCDDGFGARHDFLHDRLRYDDDAVAVAEEGIASRDDHRTYCDRLSEAIAAPALHDVAVPNRAQGVVHGAGVAPGQPRRQLAHPGLTVPAPTLIHPTGTPVVALRWKGAAATILPRPPACSANGALGPLRKASGGQDL